MPEGSLSTALILLILLYSIILHEVSHGIAALLNGDVTAREAGRLTLNPAPHIDLIGSVLLPAALFFSGTGLMFGWAKPVPFDARRFRRRRLGIFTVGLAGPLTNVILAVIFAWAYRNLAVSVDASQILLYGAAINVGLAIFNLIPIPPLDGSRAVMVFLPPSARRLYSSVERWGFVIILFLAYSGALRPLITPVFVKAMTWLTGAAVQ